MSTPNVPSPPEPPPSPPAPRPSGNRALPWAFALAMVAVVAAATVAIVWLTRGNGSAAADAPTTTFAASSSTEPITTSSLAPSTSTSLTTSTSSTSSSTTTSTSTTTSSTSTTTTTSTTLPPGACTGPGAGPIPDGMTVVTEVTGDFDGNGVSDDRFLLLTGSTGGTVPRLELSYGYSVSRTVFTPRAWAGDARAVNLGGPADLAVVQIVFGTGRGAYLWALHECDVRLVTEQGSHVWGFALIDGPSQKRGLTCLENGIRLTEAASEDGITWWAGGSTLLFDPATATLRKPPWFGPGDGPITAFVPLRSPEDDALIQSYADFDC